MKKIALSVVVASTFALAACGGTAANNTAADAVNNAEANAIETMNVANELAANEIGAATNHLQDATNQAEGAAQDISSATANVANAAEAAGH